MIQFCGNANTIYRRSAWKSLPFDENIRTAEDKLWLREMFAAGGRIAIIPAARTLNCNQASLVYMFRKGYSDACARSQKDGESPGTPYRPMRLYDLAGALKNLLKQKLRGENWPSQLGALQRAHLWPVPRLTTASEQFPGLEMSHIAPSSQNIPRVLLATAGGWHLPHTARAFEVAGALSGLWISGKNSNKIAANHYRRCWPFHLAMKPFYHLAPQILQERAFYAFLPIWKKWLRSQAWPDCNVVQAIMGFATEPFDRAEASGALKVVDCPNSHPTSYFGYWQRECDLWCPGESVPIPRWMFAPDEPGTGAGESHPLSVFLCA
ncbi:MAG: hypothetical protein WDN00_00870 [Limisphaerales bacterium]